MKKHFLLVIKVVPVIAIALCGVYILLVFTAVISIASGTQEKETLSYSSLSPQTEAYRVEVRQTAQAEGIGGYTNHLLAIMDAVTGGEGTDVMASGGFVSNQKYPQATGSISDPSYSIRCGVKEFSRLLKLLEIQNPEDTDKLLLLYQAYHMGEQCLPFFQENGGYSEELAKQFLTDNALDGYMACFALLVEHYVAVQVHSLTDWGNPLATKNVSCPYGYRAHPVTGKFSLHTGTDLSEAEGSPITASQDGIVVKALLNDEVWGNQLVIKHSGVYSTMYAHCSEITVSEGDFVTKGETVARVGHMGYSTDSHLHFEVWRDGAPIDPIALIS